MKRSYCLFILLFLSSQLCAQIEEVIFEEDFNVFLPDNISLGIQYESAFPFDTLEYMWRQISVFDQENQVMDGCSINGSSFMQAGNQQLPPDWNTEGTYSTSMIVSDIEVQEFDSLKLSFQYVLYDISDWATLTVYFSNNGGASWNETASYSNTVLSQNCDPVDPTFLDVSGIQGQTVSLKMTFEGWRWVGLDNLSLLGYRSETSEVYGCTYQTACNYNPDANIDDNSCQFVGFACDDNDPNTLNDSFNADCICEGEVDSIILGCMDAEACNYNENATQDDGNCEYLPLFFIEGNLSPVVFEIQTYTYQMSEGSSYDWSCNGGAIQSGNGTNEIGVIWAESGVGEVCVIETNEGCQGQEVCSQVAIVPVGVPAIEALKVSFFPNPASDGFTISSDQSEMNAKYEVYDLQGRLMIEGLVLLGETSVSTETLAEGCYLLKVKESSRVFSDRILIQRD